MIPFLQLLWFFLPAYIANSVPPLLAKCPLLGRWKTPVDCGKEWNKRRLLGDNKTWRGLIGGVILAGIVFLIQAKYSSVAPQIPYASLPLWFGLLLGFGALLGDLVKSFFKRRFTIRPGGSWVPFDQIDYVLGAFALTFWLYWPGWLAFAFLLVVGGMISAAAHYLGSVLKINKDKF